MMEKTDRMLRWRMMALAFLGHNCGLGLVYGSFGPLVVSTQQQFSITRAQVSLAVTVMTLVYTLLSPVAGILIQRVSLRASMVTGTVCCAVGYYGLAAVESSYILFLALYGVIGVGLAFLAVIAPITLVSRWFDNDRAKVMGIVTLPIFMLLIPMVIGHVLPHYGRTAIDLGLAVVFTVLTPLLLFVAEPDKRNTAANASAEVASPATTPVFATRDFFRYPAFWLVLFTFGCLAGAGIVFTVHLAPFGIGRQLQLEQATMLVTVYAASGILGNLFFGWFADRYSAPLGLATIAFSQAVLCVLLLRVDGFGILVIAGLLGAGSVPVGMLLGATFSSYFGPVNVSRVLGLSYGLKLPFNLGAAPLAGYLFDRTGSYDLPMLVVGGILLVATVTMGLAMMLPAKDGRSMSLWKAAA